MKRKQRDGRLRGGRPGEVSVRTRGRPTEWLGNRRHALGTKPEKDFRRFRAQSPWSRRGGGQRSGICWTLGSYLKTQQLLYAWPRNSCRQGRSVIGCCRHRPYEVAFHFLPFFFFLPPVCCVVFSTLTAPAPPTSSSVSPSSLTAPPCVASCARFLPFLPLGR